MHLRSSRAPRFEYSGNVFKQIFAIVETVVVMDIQYHRDANPLTECQHVDHGKGGVIILYDQPALYVLWEQLELIGEALKRGFFVVVDTAYMGNQDGVVVEAHQIENAGMVGEIRNRCFQHFRIVCIQNTVVARMRGHADAVLFYIGTGLVEIPAKLLGPIPILRNLVGGQRHELGREPVEKNTILYIVSKQVHQVKKVGLQNLPQLF